MMKLRAPFHLFILAGWISAAPLASSFVPATNHIRNTIVQDAKVLYSAARDDDVIPNCMFNPKDGSVLCDHNGTPVTIDRMLATKPLRGELLTRPGPGNRELTYLSGESIISTLNDIFGYDGWNLEILDTDKVACEQQGDRWKVAYATRVRITLTASGTYKEDFGTGDAADRQLATALQLALKASVTDAVKRAARHFGDKLGNCLYKSDFNINNAPQTLQQAFDQYDKERMVEKFGGNAAAAPPAPPARKNSVRRSSNY